MIKSYEIKDMRESLKEQSNNINGTNCPATDAHFDNTFLFSDARGQNI